MKYFRLILALVISATSVEVSAASPREKEIAHKLFVDSIVFFNTDLRHPVSGQYFDAINLNSNNQETNSSVAATGMGLISLALGDATGNIPNASFKATHTLKTIMNSGFSKRHKYGWFRHWFNAEDGKDNDGSRGDGFSTIDTSILVAGAVLTANYFKAVSPDKNKNFIRLSEQLLQSVKWESAIADFDRGKMYMNYDLDKENPKSVTSKFNEYVILGCMGKLAEKSKGISGPMTVFWNKHFSKPKNLPKKNYLDSSISGGRAQVLTDHPLHYLSSFTIQFAYYLCGDISNSTDYIQFFKSAQLIDKAWFKKQGAPSHYWGSGAGEAINGYEANAVANNENLIVSPHIISGFMSENSNLITDLVAIYDEKKCTYRNESRELLWRCSLKQPTRSLERVQAIDFSTMVFGLSTLEPKVGNIFYKKFSGK